MTVRDAIGFEYLIRKAYNCGRFGAPGANADIFETYEIAQIRYRENLEAEKKKKPKTWDKPMEELAFIAGCEAGEVATYINVALEHVNKKYHNELNEKQKEGFEECRMLLTEPTEKNIGDALQKGHELLEELGLGIG